MLALITLTFNLSLIEYMCYKCVSAVIALEYSLRFCCSESLCNAICLDYPLKIDDHSRPD